MCFNGAKSWQLGWYADKRHVEIDVRTTIKSYSGKLVPILDDPEESGDPMIIKVETGPDEDYYILFNRASGFNADTVEGGNKVMITKTDKDNLSWSQAKLSATQTWSISVDQNSGLDDILNVKVNSINLSDGNGYALVEVYLTSSNCIHRTGLCKKVPGCRWKNNQCMRDYCKDYGTDKTSCKADSACKWKWMKQKCTPIPEPDPQGNQYLRDCKDYDTDKTSSASFHRVGRISQWWKRPLLVIRIWCFIQWLM